MALTNEFQADNIKNTSPKCNFTYICLQFVFALGSTHDSTNCWSAHRSLSCPRELQMCTRLMQGWVASAGWHRPGGIGRVASAGWHRPGGIGRVASAGWHRPGGIGRVASAGWHRPGGIGRVASAGWHRVPPQPKSWLRRCLEYIYV